jgi:hypothetical protein
VDKHGEAISGSLNGVKHLFSISRNSFVSLMVIHTYITIQKKIAGDTACANELVCKTTAMGKKSPDFIRVYSEEQVSSW